MNRFICYCKLFFCCGCLIGCDNSIPEETKPSGSIIGCITDYATGDAIPYANIQLRPSGETTLTGSDGMYEFIDLHAGRYSLNISKAEYLELNDDYIIELQDGKTIRRDVQLQKQVASLMITDTDGNAIQTIDFGSEESVISKSFNIFNNGTVSIACQLTYTCSWISSVSIIPDTIYPGQTVNVTVIINRALLDPGPNNSTYLHISSNNGSKDLLIQATGKSAPSVHMDPVSSSSIGFEDALLKGSIVEEGLPPYKECGFVIGNKKEPTILNALQTVSFKTLSSKEFSQKVGGLRPETKYYVRAYAINDNDEVYSNQEEFSTKTPEKPVIKTLKANEVYETGATLNAYVQSTGKPAFTKKGFVISYSNNQPTIKNSSGWYIAGVQTGEYGLILTGLNENSTYHVRAFAITPYDTVYFNVVTVPLNKPYVAIGNLGVRIEDDYDHEYNRDKMSHYYAKRVCDKLVLGKYDDWRLPTSDELSLIYSHRNEIGGFSSDKYWTATQNQELPNWESGAWNEGWVVIDFATGEVMTTNPLVSYNYRVRAVRSLY